MIYQLHRFNKVALRKEIKGLAVRNKKHSHIKLIEYFFLIGILYFSFSFHGEHTNSLLLALHHNRMDK